MKVTVNPGDLITLQLAVYNCWKCKV
jgi:hypothetical protein